MKFNPDALVQVLCRPQIRLVDMAKSIGFTSQHLSNLKYKRKTPTVTLLAAIATVSGDPIQFFFTLEPGDPGYEE